MSLVRRRRPRCGLPAALLLAVAPTCLLVAAASPTATAADATVSPAGSSTVAAAVDTTVSPVAAARATFWTPCLRDTRQMLANLAAWPPQAPLVVVLGGSAFRDCTTTDEALSRAIGDLVGSPVEAYNLSSSMRTFGVDREYVRLLPPGPTIVVIGISEVRFAHGASDPTFELPSPIEGWRQTNWHHYDDRRRLTRKQKRALLRDWMRRGYPLFKRRYRYNLERLRELVEECRERGFHPVLLNAPYDGQVVGRTLDRVSLTRRRACGSLVLRYRVPFIDLNRATTLKSRDFQDLWHLGLSGREKWERRLTERVARLLVRYGMVTPAEPYADALR